MTDDATYLRETAALMRARVEAYPSDEVPMAARVDIDHTGTCDGCDEYKTLVASSCVVQGHVT